MKIQFVLISFLFLWCLALEDVIGQQVDKPTPSEGFSPNGDGINEFWYIRDIEQFPENTVSIYNRWGVLLREIDDYDNEGNYFDATSVDHISNANIKVPFGTYYFIIRISGRESIDGYFLVAR